MSRLVNDQELIQELKEVIDSSDWYLLCDIAEFVFGGRFAYDVNQDAAVLTPNDEYGGAFGALEWEVEASFYDMDTDPGTPYAQKTFVVEAYDASDALEKAKEMAYFDDETKRAESCSVEVGLCA